MFKTQKRAESDPQKPGYSSSNINMLLISAAFLVLAIGLIVIQPDTPPSDVNAEVPTKTAVEPVTEVSRADASLLDLAPTSAAEAVSRQLRQPIRLTDTDARHTDLRSLTAAVLSGFGHRPQSGDPLQALLVQALTEGQSNAYIDALLNTAAARGEFKIPVQLTTSAGRLDTDTLLSALVRQSQG